MGLQQNINANIWSLEDRGKYVVASMSTQKKQKDGTYKTDWSNKFVHLIGNAFEKIRNYSLNEGEYIRIVIRDFEVTNNWDKVKRVLYTNYTIFDFDFQNSASNEENQEGEDFTNVPIGDDFNLPFE